MKLGKQKINLVKAKLVKSISYTKDENEISITENSEILVDTNKDIALIGQDHVVVTPDEYEILFSK